MDEEESGGLFDGRFGLDKIAKQNDPLEKLQAHMDFEILRSLWKHILN